MLAVPATATPAVLSAKDAVARHMRWRCAFQLAIRLEEPLTQEQMDQVCHAGRCAIGRWLDSEAVRPMRACLEYKDLYACHLAFHDEMKLIATMLATGRFDQAARAIAPNSAFERASTALATSIITYDRIATMALPT